MARKYETHVIEEKSVEINLKVEGLQEYMEAWLWFCNNAREYSDRIYKVSNTAGDSIFILVNPEYADTIKSIAEDFGEVVWVEDKVAVFVDVCCHYGNFDKDYIDSEYVLGEED